MLGDPNRKQSDIKGVSSYLNRRLWAVPDGDRAERRRAPRAGRSSVADVRRDRHGPMPTAHGRRSPDEPAGDAGREVLHLVPGRRRSAEGSSPSTAQVRWTNEPRSTGTSGTANVLRWSRYAASAGTSARQYRNELYDVTAHHSTYRSFGVSEASVPEPALDRPPLRRCSVTTIVTACIRGLTKTRSS